MEITAAATFCATITDEWVRCGVTAAFVAPGSRSTPLAMALVADRRLHVAMFHDERSASFAALGHALATHVPSVLLCTSGTAAAHFSAAVIEAHLSCVPLIVCTADRPPELWDIGASQTVDQTKLYANSVRWFCEPGVADEATSSAWRSLGARSVAEAMGWSGRRGPVHFNLSFRDPLAGQSGPLPTGRDAGAPWHQIALGLAEGVSLIASRLGRSGVIVAGGGVEDPESVLRLGERLGWPVLADHRSGCRVPGRAVAHSDALIRSASFADTHVPEVVLHVGEAPASKVVNQWLATCGAQHIVVVPRGRWIDPDRVASLLAVDEGLMEALLGTVGADREPDPSWKSWMTADVVAARTIAELLDGDVTVSEPAVARAVVAAVPTGGALVVSSSMPVRDVEWFGAARADMTVLANRGANGIDGVISTAVGAALAGAPTVCLLGDVAFLHDSAGLVALARRTVDLTIVVVDNDGGGIFSFLPQASVLPPADFERLFGTPHGTSTAALIRAHGISVVEPVTLDDLRACVVDSAGVRVVLVHTERVANVAMHQHINERVIAALRTAPE